MISLPRAAAAAVMLAVWAAPSAAQQPGPAPGRDPFVTPTLPPPAVITRDEYARRRAALAARMSDGVLVVFGA
ncbi:MAG TPA: hypothetical protein VFS20_17155, partial [Longimicrobium sp.]|nr:hypothetical protein [Longimicrobium sp.]